MVEREDSKLIQVAMMQPLPAPLFASNTCIKSVEEMRGGWKPHGHNTHYKIVGDMVFIRGRVTIEPIGFWPRLRYRWLCFRDRWRRPVSPDKMIED